MFSAQVIVILRGHFHENPGRGMASTFCLRIKRLVFVSVLNYLMCYDVWPGRSDLFSGERVQGFFIRVTSFSDIA